VDRELLLLVDLPLLLREEDGPDGPTKERNSDAE
jgi:hypothetical protein